MRRRPGASRKGVRKAVTEAEKASKPAPQQISPEAAEALTQAGYRETVAWVIEHRTHGILRKALSEPMPALMHMRTLCSVMDRQENTEEFPWDK
jgi:hypothetical protein